MVQRIALMALVVSLAACGDSEVSGEPLVFGSLMGEYDGSEFEPISGYATTSMGRTAIVLGTGSVACSTQDSSSPPSGYTAVISAPEFTVGSYGSVFVQIFKNVGGFEGTGSNGGSLEITDVGTETLSGTIDYAFTNPNDKFVSISGAFEVILCAP